MYFANWDKGFIFDLRNRKHPFCSLFVLTLRVIAIYRINVFLILVLFGLLFVGLFVFEKWRKWMRIVVSRVQRCNMKSMNSIVMI